MVFLATLYPHNILLNKICSDDMILTLDFTRIQINGVNEIHSIYASKCIILTPNNKIKAWRYTFLLIHILFDVHFHPKTMTIKAKLPTLYILHSSSKNSPVNALSKVRPSTPILEPRTRATLPARTKSSPLQRDP